jgi:hypothetical protein
LRGMAVKILFQEIVLAVARDLGPNHDLYMNPSDRSLKVVEISEEAAEVFFKSWYAELAVEVAGELAAEEEIGPNTTKIGQITLWVE